MVDVLTLFQLPGRPHMRANDWVDCAKRQVPGGLIPCGQGHRWLGQILSLGASGEAWDFELQSECRLRDPCG
jgi:hypothetical protein